MPVRLGPRHLMLFLPHRNSERFLPAAAGLGMKRSKPQVGRFTEPPSFVRDDLEVFLELNAFDAAGVTPSPRIMQV